MYGENDYKNAETKMKARLGVAIGILAIAVGAMCAGIAVRNKWLATISPVLGGWVLYTWWALKFMPWFRYNKYLQNMRQGRHRETQCYFVDASDQTRIVDGVQIHDFNASLDAAGEDLRLFYWDGDKPMPEMQKGQKLRLISYGNFITECVRE